MPCVATPGPSSEFSYRYTSMYLARGRLLLPFPARRFVCSAFIFSTRRLVPGDPCLATRRGPTPIEPIFFRREYALRFIPPQFFAGTLPSQSHWRPKPRKNVFSCSFQHSSRHLWRTGCDPPLSFLWPPLEQILRTLLLFSSLTPGLQHHFPRLLTTFSAPQRSGFWSNV